MKPFLLRFANKEPSAGRIGYFLVKGEEDGSWRVTDREYGHHEIVGACDTPEALMPRVLDHLNEWLEEQRAVNRHNVGVLDRAPERRQGFRLGWKKAEYAKDRLQLERSEKSHRRVIQAVATILAAKGWPTAPYDGPLLSEDAVISSLAQY